MYKYSKTKVFAPCFSCTTPVGPFYGPFSRTLGTENPVYSQGPITCLLRAFSKICYLTVSLMSALLRSGRDPGSWLGNNVDNDKRYTLHIVWTFLSNGNYLTCFTCMFIIIGEVFESCYAESGRETLLFQKKNIMKRYFKVQPKLRPAPI